MPPLEGAAGGTEVSIRADEMHNGNSQCSATTCFSTTECLLAHIDYMQVHARFLATTTYCCSLTHLSMPFVNEGLFTDLSF